MLESPPQFGRCGFTHPYCPFATIDGSNASASASVSDRPLFFSINETSAWQLRSDDVSSAPEVGVQSPVGGAEYRSNSVR
jgi:hypothetical protein